MASIIKHSFVFVLAGLTFGLIASADGSSSLERGAQSVAQGRQSAMPLRVPFVQNQGQIADPQMLFYARTFGGTVYVTAAGELVYVLPKRVEHGAQMMVLCEALVDADLVVLPAGAERSGAVINSFVGNDPRRWQSELASFAGVRLGDVYEGISLEVRATGDNVEKIFTVAPGADPARIALRLSGAEGLSITPAGELEARTALGPVRFTAPVAYQESAVGARQYVSVAYALEGDRVGFCVGAFDAARPLVIDPLLASTFIGGTSNNVVRAMAVDSQTNVLVAGWTASLDFPTNGPYQGSYGGGLSDGFIAKFDPQLTNLLAATYLGGAGEDAIMAMGINTNNGAVYLAGYTASHNFPTQNAAYSNYNGGAYDAFVSVLDSNLVTLTASTYLGGTNVDLAYALALSAGPTPDVFVAGLTCSTNFPINNTWATSFRTTLSGAAAAITNDAFVARFNAELSTNRASTYLGGTNDDGAYGLALDTNNFVYVAGYTTSTNFPMTNGAIRLYRGGVRDAFVARLPVALTNLNAATFLGGTNDDCANGIAVAPFTNIVCVVGYTYSTNFTQNPTNNVIAPGYTNQYMGGKDAFLTRFNMTLSNVLASTYLGDTNDDEATAVLAYAGVTNNSLRIYVAGWTTSTNFPVTTNAYDTSANGARDAFVSYFGTGLTLKAATYLGGSTDDTVYAMAWQADSFALFVAGATASTNFPATVRAYDNDRAGRVNDDGFVTKLGSGLAYGTKKWQVIFDTNTAALTAMAGSPSLGWDGSIYCGYGSNLYAFDAQGRQLWKTSCAGVMVYSSLTDINGMGSIPAVSTNGTIYVTTDTPGSLQAISPTGGVKWAFSSDHRSEFSSPAIGSNGVIYFGSFGGFLYAVRDNGDSCIGLWTNRLGSAICFSPAIASNGDIFVAMDYNDTLGYLYSITTNGATNNLWNLAGPTYSSPTFGPNGRVYIGSGTKLYAFDPGDSTTQHVWTAGGQIYCAPTIGTNGVIYVGGGTNLYEFYQNGTSGKVWVTDGKIKSSPALGSDGSIIVGSENTGLFSFNPGDGTTNWVLTFDEYVYYNSPLIQRDGTIYMTDANNLYAVFGPAPLNRTNWPVARHDVLRTGDAAFDAAKILKPTGLAVSRGAYLDRVLVSWSGDPNADYYEIFRGTNDLASASLCKTLAATNYWDTSIGAGLIYHYWIRVATPVAMSDFSESSSGGVPPLAPTGVEASKGNPTNAIVITWNPSENANTYNLYRSLVNVSNTAVLLTNTAATVYTNAPPNITRGLTYYYWAQAGNGSAGTSGFSAGIDLTHSGGTPPLPPTNVTAGYGVAYQALDVAWSTAPTGATMYVVYRSQTNEPPGSSVVAITNELAFSDRNTVAYQHYFYWVRATNLYGMGEFTDNSAEGFRLLRPPQAVYATKGVFTNQIGVAWQLESEPTSYLVYRSLTPDSATAVLQFEVPYPTATNYYDKDITRGAGYYYWMQSKNDRGTSVISTAYDLGGTPPFPPSSVNASDGTDATKIMVTWTAAAYATAYEVYRQETYPWSVTTPIGNAYGMDYYPDTDALSGHIYYYWVKATNQFGRSELSGFNTGWRPLTAPYNLAASDGVSTGYVKVTWNNLDSTSANELWRGTNSDRAAALVLANAVSTNYYYDTDAAPGVLFYYWVRAKTSQFVSDFSSDDSGYRPLGEVDLGISDLVFLPTRMAVGGAPYAVSFRVTNHGVQNMAVPNTWVACNFYVSSNSVFGDADDRWMGGTNVSVSLAVGNSAVVTLPKTVRAALTVPEVVPGWYYVFANIQHVVPSMWRDPNLANNTASRNGGGVIKIGATQPAGLLLVNDYNGDGYTDQAMYQETTGTWQVWFSGVQGFTLAGYGGAGFKPAPGDYDGDGKTDLAVYREATGTWEIWFSASDYAMVLINGWGDAGFEPVPSDYDGDGKADPAVYQESTGTWRIWLSASAYAMVSDRNLGGTGWRPVPGDFDGDGKADPAIYQESTGTWRIWQSRLNYAQVAAAGLGGSGYRPVAADYDLDGIMDPAVFHANSGTWRIWLSGNNYTEVSAQGLGGAGMLAVPGDYDGDGQADPAVYWDSFGMWRLWLSGSGYQQTEVLAWPGAGFRPVWNN